jgi:hypothetical protein
MRPSSWTRGSTQREALLPHCVVSHIPSTEEINNPILPRSEAKQLVRAGADKGLEQLQAASDSSLIPPSRSANLLNCEGI